MKKSIVCEKMRRGEVVLTAKQNFMNPNLSELIGYAGFDCLWLCNEHQAIDRSLLENMARTGRISGADVMVRTGFGDYTDLIQPLEFGAQGLMIPHIRSVKQLEEIVREVRFHPIGRRGMDCVNEDADQGMATVADYIRFANENTFLCAQIEDPEALAQADALAAIPGVDILFLGPADYAQSIGIPGETRHPKVYDAILRTVEACARHGIYCGTVGFGDPEFIRRLIADGVKFIAGPSDYGMLRGALAAEVAKYEALGFEFRHYNPQTGTME